MMFTQLPLREAEQDEDDLIAIYCKLLIPGRGKPIQNAAVGVSTKTGKITFLGSQSSAPTKVASAPRTEVNCLLPGLWDCHTHFAGVLVGEFINFINTHPATLGAMVTRGFYDTLMAGFTSVRDAGSFAIEAYRAVEAGLVLGPHVYGAGGCIGITGGSSDATTIAGDFVYSRQGIGPQNHWPGHSVLVLADGVDNCRLAVRQQVRRGASVIKVITTGGIMSATDDPKYRQYSDDELAAFIDEARLQGRAVMAHAHGKAGIVASVKAGAISIEHGTYLDDEAAKLMKENGVSLVATRYVFEAFLDRLDKLNPHTASKLLHASEIHKQAYQTAIKHGVKIAIGTDMAESDPDSMWGHGKNGKELVYAVNAGLSPLEAIEAATANAAETLGPKTPTKGILKEGWDADMIALDENPLDDIHLLAEADNIKYVWQDGKLVKAPGQVFWPKPRRVEGTSEWQEVGMHGCCNF